MTGSSFETVFHLLLCTTGALAVVLLVRLPLRGLFGAQLSYTAWALVPLIVFASLVPLPMSLPAEGLPQVTRIALPAAATEWIIQVGRRGPDVPAWLFAGWFAVAAGFLLMQLGKQWAFMRRLQPLRSAGDGAWVTHAPGFTPAVVGTFHPRIVLPADFRERYTAQEQDLVLAHERMHVQRHDPMVNLVALILRALLWFHPLAHLAARYLQMDQELACDAAVIATRPRCRRAYARALLKTQLTDFASPFGCAWKPKAASFLERRFIMLKKSGPSRSRTVTGAISIAAAAVLAAGVAWAAQPHEGSTAATVPTAETQAQPTDGGKQSGKSPEPLHFDNLDDLMKGTNGKRPILLIDGRRATDAEVKSVPLSTIERIEVLPKDSSVAATYGPGAQNGVINIVKRR